MNCHRPSACSTSYHAFNDCSYVTELKAKCIQTSYQPHVLFSQLVLAGHDHVANNATTMCMCLFALPIDSDVNMVTLIGIADIPHRQQGSSCFHMRGQIMLCRS